MICSNIERYGLEAYAGHRPTGFDRHINIERDSWALLPTSQNRDSGTLERSNFATALKILGSESETVEVHRFGHWACGWYEIIVVDVSDDRLAQMVYEICAALQNYPVLDEEHWSELQHSEAYEYWQHMSIADRVHACQKYEVCIFAARRDDVPESRTGELIEYLADGC